MTFRITNIIFCIFGLVDGCKLFWRIILIITTMSTGAALKKFDILSKKIFMGEAIET